MYNEEITENTNIQRRQSISETIPSRTVALGKVNRMQLGLYTYSIYKRNDRGDQSRSTLIQKKKDVT